MFDINIYKLLNQRIKYNFFLYNYLDIFFVYNFIFSRTKIVNTKKTIHTSKWRKFSSFFFIFFLKSTIYATKNSAPIQLLNPAATKYIIKNFNNVLNLIYLLTTHNRNILFITESDELYEVNILNYLFLGFKNSAKFKTLLHLNSKKFRKKKYRFLIKQFIYFSRIKFIFFLELTKKPLWLFFFKRLNIPLGGLIDFNVNPLIYDYPVVVPSLSIFYKFLFLLIIYDVYKLGAIQRQNNLILSLELIT